MQLLRILASLFAVAVLTGCDGTPSESDGRKLFESSIQSRCNGLIKLVSFEKTDGVQQELFGMKFYEMKFTAGIEILDDCTWNIWDEGKGVSASRRQPGEGLGLSRNFGYNLGSKGQLCKVSGKFTFQKTEKGWGPPQTR
jgi:hypothetical protein